MINAGLFILVAMAIAALLGYFIAYYTISSRIEEWQKKFNLKEDEYATLERTHQESIRYKEDLEKRNKGLNVDIEKLKAKSNTDIAAEKERYSKLETDLRLVKSDLNAKSSVEKELNKVRGQHDELKARFQQKDSTINDLMAANDNLEKEKRALVDQLNARPKADKVKEPKPAKPKEEAKAEAKPQIVEKIVDEKVFKEYEEKLKVLRKRNDNLELEFNKLNKNLDTVNKQKSTIAQNLDTANTEIEELKKQLKGNDNQAELEKLNTRLATMQVELDKTKKDYGGLQLTNGDLIKQINVFKSKPVETVSDEYKEKYDALIKEHEGSTAKIAALEKDHADCGEKVTALQKEIEELKAKPAPAPAPVSTGDAKKDEVLNRIREKAKNINFERIGKANEGEKDDLKEIKGIGPFIEDKLNALGISTFKQIANFTDEDDDLVNDAIEFFPGRVKRDDWKGQAKELMKGKDS